MKKEIYLIRHAKSSWQHAGEIADIDRPLAIKGLLAAKKMSEKLAHKKVAFDKIFASNGIRALHTATIFAKTMYQEPSLINVNSQLYLPLKSNILDVIKAVDDKDRVIAIFTHDPGITDFAFNSNANLQHVATAGIVHYTLDEDNWNEASFSNLEFESYDFPKNHLA